MEGLVYFNARFQEKNFNLNRDSNLGPASSGSKFSREIWYYHFHKAQIMSLFSLSKYILIIKFLERSGEDKRV